MQEHQWQFFTSSESAWEELIRACESATQSIDLEEYVFGMGGAVEKRFTDLFVEKAAAGVKVRMLLDAVGSFSFYRCADYDRLEKAGVEIHYHFAVLSPSIRRLLPFILRDHRKLVVVDNTAGYIGGVIIQERAREWRDSLVRIEGQVVKDMQEAFEKVWKRTEKMKPVGQVRSENEHKEFWIAGNSFHLRDKDLYRAFLRAITSAKKTIHITTPYFFPNQEFLRALFFARERGVEIKILLPKISDNKIADFLAKFYYPRLRKHGVRIFFYTKKVLHAKTMVIDGNWSTIGSCNFDLLSFWWNYELNLMSSNTSFAQELEQQFTRDLEDSTEHP